MKLPQLSRSPRDTIEKTDNSLIITIRSRRNFGALFAMALLLLFWVYMFTMLVTFWSVMLMAVKEAVGSGTQGIFIFIVCVISIFLLYMLLHGIYAIYISLREIAGKEIITINESRLAVTQDLFGWKREREFPAKSLGKLILKSTSQHLFKSPFAKQYKYAFEINHDGKTYRFGYYVKEDEAKEILSAIYAFISPAS